MYGNIYIYVCVCVCGVLMLLNKKIISTIVQQKIKKFIALFGAEM